MENFIFWFQNDSKPEQSETVTVAEDQRIQQLERRMSSFQRTLAVQIGTLNEMVDFLAFQINRPRSNETGSNSEPSTDLIQSNYIPLTRAIRVDVPTVVGHLFMERIINDVTKEDILSTQNKYRGASYILDTIHRLGDQAQNALYRATLSAELWTAADILCPENRPHGPVVEDSCSQPLASMDASVDGIYDSGLLYARSNSVQAADLQEQMDSLNRTVKDLRSQILVLRRPRGLSEPDGLDSNHDDTDRLLKETFLEHQKLVRNHEVPVGESNYVDLAALEYIARVADGPARDIGMKSFPSSFGQDLEQRKRYFRQQNYTQHRAAHEYIKATSPLPHLQDMNKFYLVQMGTTRQYKILSISEFCVKLLNSDSKEETKSWRLTEIKGCHVEPQNRLTLTMEFHSGECMRMFSKELKAQEISGYINNVDRSPTLFY